MDHAHIRVYNSLLGTLATRWYKEFKKKTKQITSLLMTKEEKITIEYGNNQVNNTLILK